MPPSPNDSQLAQDKSSEPLLLSLSGGLCWGHLSCFYPEPKGMQGEPEFGAR